ncbi:MAG TPA: hypothetical protein VKA09_17950 [Nitrososphaeraceae archaeon]|nr:hypothetical protein [Nitrososphaeraceae archaeon]
MTVAYSNTITWEKPVTIGLYEELIIKAANITNVIIDEIIV